MQITNPGIKSYLQTNIDQSRYADKPFFGPPKEETPARAQAVQPANDQRGAPGQTSGAQEKAASVVAAQPNERFYASYEATTEAIKNYNAYAADLRRSDAINTYTDNGGEFTRVGDRASILPINQVDLSQRDSVRAVGIANEGELNRDAQAMKYTLLATTRAIESYNLIAQSAKDAQNHATYMQNSLLGLNYAESLGSA